MHVPGTWNAHRWARDPKPARDVGLKVLPVEASGDKQRRLRFVYNYRRILSERYIAEGLK